MSNKFGNTITKQKRRNGLIRVSNERTQKLKKNKLSGDTEFGVYIYYKNI